MRGCIVKRNKGYSIVVDVGRDEHGRRRQQWIAAGRTRREAEAKLTEVMHSLSAGTSSSPQR